jgi:hypothetical protein
MAIDQVFWMPGRDFVRVDGTTNALVDGAAGTLHAIYYQGFDVHVLRNGVGTGDLRNYLFVQDSVTKLRYRLIDALGMAGLNIKKAEFLPTLKEGLAFNDADAAGPFAGPSFTPAGKALFSSNNVSVNTYTGEVSATALPVGTAGYMKNYNFILLIRIEVGAGNTPYESAVRVHIHDTITAAWITPTTLTVREREQVRFSVYAEFSDGIVGDISVHPGITWSCSNGRVNIFADSAATTIGVFSVPVGVGGGQMTAELPPALRTAINVPAVTAGTIIVQTAWNIDIPTRPMAKLVGGGPGIANRESCYNFLFIAEGFTRSPTDMEPAFDQIMLDIYGKFASETNKHPWNILRNSVNFFSLFLPSADSGVSLHNEVVSVDQLDTSSVLIERSIRRQWSIQEYIENADLFFEGGKIGVMMPRSVYTRSGAIPPLTPGMDLNLDIINPLEQRSFHRN